MTSLTTLLRARPAPARALAVDTGLLTLEALLADGGDLVELTADAETIALALPLFDRVAATTMGPHALISTKGAYGPVRMAGQALLNPARRIALRLLAGRNERLVLRAFDAARRRPAALCLFGADGHLRHKTEIAAPEDLMVLAAVVADLGAAPLGDVAPPAPVMPMPASIPVIRQMQSDWVRMDRRAHLDGLILDGGQGRGAALRHVPGATPVALDRVRPFLLHLAQSRLPFCRAVLRPGCLQWHSGAVEVMSEGAIQPTLVLRSKSSLFALDLNAVAACWRVNWPDAAGKGREAVLELYDANGLCLALIGPAGAGRATQGRSTQAREADHWARLTDLLA